jgi:hypothetical protein
MDRFLNSALSSATKILYKEEEEKENKKEEKNMYTST